MADNEKLKRSHPPRRNPQPNRPPPGVQKAMQNFGVTDLREILDKKHQEQGESQGDKRPDPKLVNLPPADPSYNYLKDPTRDQPKPPTQRKGNYERPTRRNQEYYSPQQRYKGNNKEENVQNTKDIKQHQENKEDNSNIQEKGVLKKNHNSPQFERAPKKELRFSDPPNFEGQPQFSRSGGRHSFRGRNVKQGSNIPRESKEGKIANPVNIKIELSIATGQRNFTLDENTKIADIKHVPDKIPHPKSPRGGFRGGRGNFRGRGRGRGSFRGRGGSSYRGKGTETKVDTANHDNSFNMEKLQKNLPVKDKKENSQSVENGNIKSKNYTSEQNSQDSTNQNVEAQENPEENLQHYDEYDQENEEYNDANENYDDEYYSEYQNDSPNHAQNVVNRHQHESSPESDRYDHGTIYTDPNLKASITITSSKFQDGEVKRSVEVTPKNNATEKEGSSTQGDGSEKN